MGFALFLFKRLGSSLSEVVQVDQANGLGLEKILGGGGLGGETGVVR